MKVVCIRWNRLFLIDEIYEVYNRLGVLSINDDSGVVYAYRDKKSYFISLEKWREQRINKILDND